MNYLQVRAAILEAKTDKDKEFPNALQVSGDGLVWWTIGRFKSTDECIMRAKDLNEFIKQHHTVNVKAVLWTGKAI